MKSFIVLFLFLLTFAVNVFGATETDRQEQVVSNIYSSNPGFENGTKDVTVSSSTKSWVSHASTLPLLGNKFLRCSFDTAGDYCETKLVANPLSASNLEWGFYYSTTGVGTIKAEIIDGSGNIIRAENPLASTTGFQEKILEFVGAASTSYKLRLTALAGVVNPTTVSIDSMHVSKNMGVGSQAPLPKEYDLKTACGGSTCITGNNSWANTKARGIVEKTRDGTWWITLDIEGTSASASSIALTFSQLSFNTTGGRQTLAASNGVSGFAKAYLNTATTLQLTGNADTDWGVSGKVKLTAMPSFATDAAAETVVRAESANQSGSATWATNGSGNASINAASWTDFSSAAHATRTNVGKAENPSDTTDLAFKVSNLPPGAYRVRAKGRMYAYNNAHCLYRINDGSNPDAFGSAYALGSSEIDSISIIEKTFVYTSLQSSLTFTLQGNRQTGTGTCYAAIEMSGFEMSIEPVYPQQAAHQIIGAKPTIQKFTSGSGTYTKPTGVQWIKVRMVGGGGGGAAAGGSHYGSAGGNTTFGTSLLTANGGGRGEYANGSLPSGGTATISSPAIGTSISGATGTHSVMLSGVGLGGNGASSPLGGAGAASLAATASSAIANTGSGGGGGSCSSGGTFLGGGGAAGGFIEAIINEPSSTYSYSVGASGNGATGGNCSGTGYGSGAGGSGYIEVTEYYL